MLNFGFPVLAALHF